MVHRGVTMSVWMLSSLMVLPYNTTCAALRVDSQAVQAHRKLLETYCSTNAVRSFFVGEYVGNNAVCARCSPGRVAWCCRSDNFATPETCMLAGPNCCSGSEYRYTYIERNGELDQDTLDDVWCMPETCTADFNVTAWPVNPKTIPSHGKNNTTPPKKSPRPGGPINTSPECTTSNEPRDFVGEYRNPRGSANAAHNRRICRACAARGQVAWCCNSLNGDQASTDPQHCQLANRGNRCCTGQRFRYSYFEDGVLEWDNMDDVWCLPQQCSAPPGH